MVLLFYAKKKQMRWKFSLSFESIFEGRLTFIFSDKTEGKIWFKRHISFPINRDWTDR